MRQYRSAARPPAPSPWWHGRSRYPFRLPEPAARWRLQSWQTRNTAARHRPALSSDRDAVVQYRRPCSPRRWGSGPRGIRNSWKKDAGYSGLWTPASQGGDTVRGPQRDGKIGQTLPYLMAIDVSVNRYFTIHGGGPKSRASQIAPKCFLTSHHPLKIFRNLTAALAVVAGLCTAHAAFANPETNISAGSSKWQGTTPAVPATPCLFCKCLCVPLRSNHVEIPCPGGRHD